MNTNRGARRFARNRGGNVAIILALCIFPLMVVVGFAIDYSYRENAQAHVQSALDMSGLAAMRLYAQDSSLTEAELQTAARTYFEAETKTLGNATLEDVTLTQTGKLASLTVKGTVPTSFVHLIGHDTLPVGSTTEVTFGEVQKVEIALVLDMSSSMGATIGTDTRLAALQSAAKNMTGALIDPSSDQFKMSIVPFSTHINVGTVHRGEFWMNADADRTETIGGACYNTDAWANANCPERTVDCGVDGGHAICTIRDCNGLIAPDSDRVCGADTHFSLSWHGCVYSRPSPYNENDQLYSTHKIHGFASQDGSSCATPIQAMTNSATDLDASIDALAAYGETYIPAGLIWGWRTLSAGAPFTEGEPIADHVTNGDTKMLILMSDGENSVSVNAAIGEHDGTDTVAADNLTKSICTKIKAKGIDVYTIAFGVTDAATKDMLKTCASSSGAYYEADDAAALTDAFVAIREQLASSLAITG